MSRLRCSARLWVFGLVLLAPAHSAQGADRPRTLSPMIQLQGSETLCTRTEPSPPFYPVCCSICVAAIWRERTISIFRNGRALSVTTETTNDREHWTPAVSVVRDGVLSNQQFQELNSFLQRTVIERRRGQCNPFLDTPGYNAPLSRERYTIHWYFSDGRSGTIPFGSDFRNGCPPGGMLDVFNFLTQIGEAIP